MVRACEQLTEGQFETLKGLGIKKVEVITDDVKADDVLLNTLRDDEAQSHEEALVRIYRRLRPGNPADEAKVKELFFDRFLNEQRYNLGSVGRFRINRKLKTESDSLVLGIDDYLPIVRYLLQLIRTNAHQGEIDDIDHLGNRRIRPIADLLADELRVFAEAASRGERKTVPRHAARGHGCRFGAT